MSIEEPTYRGAFKNTEDPVFPWDYLEDEKDGFLKNFAAWERWMKQKFSLLLDKTHPEQQMKIYETMVELASPVPTNRKRGNHETH